MTIFFPLLTAVAVAGVPVAPAEPAGEMGGPRVSDGWIQLYNGKDLTGWDALGKAKWTVLGDGTLSGRTGSGEYGNLVTRREYSDFVLRVSCLFEGPGNSGIHFRGTVKNEWQVHGYQCEADPAPTHNSGGVYDSYGRGWIFKPEGEAARAVNPEGWNHYVVSAIGDHILIYLNGYKTADFRDPAARKGVIALQVHSGEGVAVRWKDIYIQDLSDRATWTRLFDGKTLAGWKVVGGGKHHVADGAIVTETAGDKSEGYLASEKVYADFDIRARVKWTGGDSGLFYRTTITEDGKNVRDAPQLQINGRGNGHGGLYEHHGRGWVRQIPPALQKQLLGRSPGWFDMEIVCRGAHTKLYVNGTKTVDFEDTTGPKKGVFALQLHSGGGVKLEWKDIYVHEISS
jgi:hypothetical protein